MILTWHGESCVRIQTRSVTANSDVHLVFDPYQTSHQGKKMPKLTADIVLTSDAQSPAHNAVDLLRAREDAHAPFLIDSPGEYEISGIMIYGIPSLLPVSPTPSSTLYTCELEGMRLLSLGAFRQRQFSDAHMESFGHIDILVIPFGADALPLADAVSLIGQVEPRIVIPLPADQKNAKQSEALHAQLAKELGVSSDDAGEKIKVTKKELPQDEMKLMPLILPS